LGLLGRDYFGRIFVATFCLDLDSIVRQKSGKTQERERENEVKIIIEKFWKIIFEESR
jgi:hypothetical protein